jgi:hypothetical protein
MPSRAKFVTDEERAEAFVEKVTACLNARSMLDPAPNKTP